MHVRKCRGPPICPKCNRKFWRGYETHIKRCKFGLKGPVRKIHEARNEQREYLVESDGQDENR
jgi:hypothetical protein